LILYPILVHPLFEEWSFFPYVGLVGSSLTLYHFTRIFGWKGFALFLLCLMATSISAWYGAPRVASVIAALPMPFFFLRWRGDMANTSFYQSIKNVCVSGVGTCSLLFGSIDLEPVMENYVFSGYRHTWHPVLLAIWWLSPSILTSCSLLVRPSRTARWAFFPLGLVCLIAGSQHLINVPTPAIATLCLGTALIISITYLFAYFNLRWLANVVVSILAIGFVWSVYRLNPTIDIDHATARQPKAVMSDDREFNDFYKNWFASRGESIDDKGVIVLVAVAGGGIRAAEHSALSLAAADDWTTGVFGSRVFAISGVSGGSLGALSWLAARRSGLLSPSIDFHHFGMLAGAWKLEGFYANDFISPVINRMISEDLAVDLSPWEGGTSSRDKVLIQAWESAWNSLLTSYGLSSDRQMFKMKLSSLNSDPLHVPMIVFNATSATDGRRAVYSNVDTGFTGAWSLNSSVTAAEAVLDSARFALVSPLGAGCGKSDISSEEDTKRCGRGFHSIPVADGGYSDNSGLASINDILDKISVFRPHLESVYVVAITSNPTQSINFLEGTRFDSGRFVAELVAPMYVMENARAGRATALSDIVEKRLPRNHFIRWDLSSDASFKYFQDEYLRAEKGKHRGFFRWIADGSARSKALDKLDLAPLGWTLDPYSAHAIFPQATDHLLVFDFPTCKRARAGADQICRDLAGYVH